jgi:hypothetical protein
MCCWRCRIVFSSSPSDSHCSSQSLPAGCGIAHIVFLPPVVAIMSHGFAARHCKPLKRNGNGCNNVRQGLGTGKFRKCPILLVPGERFELPTNGLQNRCSTTELTRQIKGLALLDTSIATGLPPLWWQFRSYSVRIRPKAASIISAALASVLANK